MNDFQKDGIAAIEASPNYFLTWYSAKSILLVAVTAALAYQLGKASVRRPSFAGRRRRRR